MQINIEFQVKPLLKVLQAVRAELAAPEMILKNVGEALLRVNKIRHAKGLAPDGTPWKELSKLTLQHKRNPRMLFERGDMLRFSYQVEGNILKIGTNDRKAIWHHDGTKPYQIRPKGKKALKFAGIVRKRVNHPGLPSRKLVGFPDSDRVLTEGVIVDHLNVILNRVR